MNLNEIIDDVTKECALPRAVVGKVAKSVLDKFADAIERQESFQSEIVAFDSVVLPAASSSDGTSLPERKVARMRIVNKK